MNNKLIDVAVELTKIEGPIAFWGKIWVFLNNFVKYLRYMQVKLNKYLRIMTHYVSLSEQFVS